MTPALSFAGRKVALFGLGGSGFATAEALRAGGASASVWDESAAARARAAAAGLDVVDLQTADWSRFSALILSPGVPLTHPEPHWAVKYARTAGIEVIGDIEIFCRERARIAPRSPFFAITGTNGKSTTTALLAHLLRFYGQTVEMGGNIGTPILELAPPAQHRCHVIELSTFQIDLTPSLRPSVGVLLNLTPDHIDRHGSMENYAAIKERLVSRADRAVVAVDDPFCMAVADRLEAQRRRLTRITTTGVPLPDGLAVDGTRIVRHTSGRGLEVLADLAGLPNLRGRHNAQNAAAAVAAAGPALLDGRDEALSEALRSFGGLPHRMELLRQRGRVLFVNDSKATNADAAEQSLRAYRDIFWIAGGVAKDGGIEPLRPWFDHVAKTYLIGKAATAFAASLDGAVTTETCGTLEAAVHAAARDAAQSDAPEPVVLLAPACASYDQFKNFEERGERFRSLVDALPSTEQAEVRP